MRRLVFVGTVLFASAGAHAGVISDNSWDGPGKDLQSLFDGWVGPGYDVNSKYHTPGYWTMGASGASIATMIIEIAGNAQYNSFGLFDRHDSNNRLVVFDGAANAYDKRAISYNAATGQYAVIDLDTPQIVDTATFSGSQFGFYLDGPGGTFFSDPVLNGDFVHMVAFQGEGQSADFYGYGKSPWLSNEWVLAWEDLPYAKSDKDFNDLVLVFESATPVPEPGIVALMGIGMLGLIALRRRRV